MEKQDLEQLMSLRAEIRELDADIKVISERNRELVTDRVQATSREWPYIQTNVTITGVDVRSDSKRKAELWRKRAILEERRKEAMELEIRITKYINSVRNSEIRRIIDMRYVKGKGWEEIGKILNCDRTTAEKKLARYLKENPEESHEKK